MLKSLIRFSAVRPGVVVVIAAVLLGYGVYRISATGLDIFPEFSPKLVIVQTEAPGFSTEQVEVLVTTPLEGALRGLIGLEHVHSESIQGLSVVTAVFEDGTDVHINRSQVGERLAAVARELPTGVADPVAVPLSSSSATIRTIGLVSHEPEPLALRELVLQTVVPRIMAVPGVADVNVFGGAERSLQIVPDLAELARFGISLNELRAVAGRATAVVGTGALEGANQRFTVATGVDGIGPEQFAATAVRSDETGVVTIGDVAAVDWAPLPRISAAQIMGRPGVILMVIGQFGANTLTVSNALESTLDDLAPLLGAQGVELFPELFVPAEYIERSLRDIGIHLLIGAAMVLVVLFIGLSDVRTALISAVAIPLSLTTALLVLIEAGSKLNVMVFAGLAIALGEVVDDAIIDTENIFRRLRERAGMVHLSDLITEASMEVRGSVVYATFIVALVFVPLLTLGGVGGRLFAPLGIAYILAVLASLIVAMSVTPALCRLLLGGRTSRLHEAPVFRMINPAFSRTLRWLVDRRGATIGVSLVGSCLILLALPYLGGRFLPELREGHYVVHTTGLPGTSLEESIRMGRRLTDAFLDIDGVVSASQWAGRAERGADTYGTHYSEYDVRLAPMSGTRQQEVLDRIRAILASIPGVTYEANTFLTERIGETISGYSAPVVVNLFGQSLAALDRAAADVAAVAGTMPKAINVRVRSVHGRPVVAVRLRADDVARFGLRAGDVQETLQALYGGAAVGEVARETRRYPVVVIADETMRIRPEDLSAVSFLTPSGERVRLGDIADVRLTSGRYNIIHRDAQRLQVVTMDVAGRDVAGFVAELERRVAEQVRFPPGVVPEFTGAALEQKRARAQLVLGALVAGSGVLILIYLAAGSIRHVFLILLNLPFSFLGGVLAVLLTGGILSIGSIVGFVTLFGITVRNSIMLVSHYGHLVDNEGLSWNADTAVRGAQERLPAIVMTALVTALAMLPLTINSDNPGREIMGPMAAIIVGGLASSTVLNLFVMPALLVKFGRFGRTAA